MYRTLTVLFVRDPSRDRQRGKVNYQGYRLLWPNRQPGNVGLDAFCQHGQRLFGLHRLLSDRQEALIKLIAFPVADRDQKIHRLPGYRVRRFFLKREGPVGRVHFMDGTPTDITFHDDDDPDVRNWIGLSYLADGEVQWLDLTGTPAETPLEPLVASVASRDGRNGCPTQSVQVAEPVAT